MCRSGAFYEALLAIKDRRTVKLAYARDQANSVHAWLDTMSEYTVVEVVSPFTVNPPRRQVLEHFHACSCLMDNGLVYGIC